MNSLKFQVLSRLTGPKSHIQCSGVSKEYNHEGVIKAVWKSWTIVTTSCPLFRVTLYELRSVCRLSRLRSSEICTHCVRFYLNTVLPEVDIAACVFKQWLKPFTACNWFRSKLSWLFSEWKLSFQFKSFVCVVHKPSLRLLSLGMIQ